MITYEDLNPTIRNLSPSATLQINEASNQLTREGRDIIKLGLGQSPFPVPDCLVNGLKKHAHEKDYLPVAGLPALRQAVAGYYQRRHGLNRQADDVLIGPGSKELLFNLQAACNAELLLPAPSWVSYAPQALMLGRRVRYFPTLPENSWQITPEQLDQLEPAEKGLNRILILNYPSNPTGCSYTAESMKAVAEAARRQKILIIADEIYAETQFAGQPKTIAGYYPEGTVISSGLSKWCGAGGWRLGTMVFPSELKLLRESMAVIASETFTSVSAPVQYAACEAYAENPEITDYLGLSRRVLQAVASYMYGQLQAAGLAIVKPVGGFYLFASFEPFRSLLGNKGVLTSGQLCQQLLSEEGVAMLPGSDFGMSPDQLFVRIAYVDFDGANALQEAKKSHLDVLDDCFVEANCPRLVLACERIQRWLGKIN